MTATNSTMLALGTSAPNFSLPDTESIIDSKATACVCENYVCKQPVNKIDGLDKMLSGISRTKQVVAG